LNPQKQLEKIRRSLAPGGKLIVTTPNAKGWRAKIDNFSWREANNPTHINLFSESALKSCLAKAGFTGVKRIFQPVTYKATGLKALALSMTQRLGIDGGLRFVAVNGSK
ncbi:MAG: methyltransferase domain-containing protein, partial [Candidatus Contendobacter sp.]|nr:methyltransferase domain-containing protein [Candidatus Contendobacter sp.]